MAASKGSLIPVLGGQSMQAGFCRAGTEGWHPGTIVDLTDSAVWAITEAPHVPGAVYLCWFRVGDHVIHIALRRGSDPLCFELLPGSRESLGGAVSASRRRSA